MFGHDLLLEHNLLSSLLGKFSIVIEKHEIKSSGIGWESLRSIMLHAGEAAQGIFLIAPHIAPLTTRLFRNLKTQSS